MTHETPEREHVLLTVLGTNPRNATYELGGATQDARLAPLALLRLLPEARRPTRVIALCTTEARRDSWPTLEENLPRGCAAELVDLPDGDSPEDVDTFLEVVAQAVPGHADLTVDVTHGFRHFSFLTYIGVLYLAALRDVEIRGAYYGLLRQGQPSPFHDLAPLLELPQWIHALKVLSETGGTRPMAEAIRARRGSSRPESQVVRNLHRELSRFSTAYLSGLPLELGAQTRLILGQHLKPLRKRLAKVHRLPLASRLVDDLEQTMAAYDLPPESASPREGWKGRMRLNDDELRRQAKVVDDLLRHGNLAVALGLMSEWTVSWVAWRRGSTAGWLDHHSGRRETANALNAMAAAVDDPELRASLRDEQRDLGLFWKSLRDLRNGYAHHGMRRDDLVASQQLRKQLDKVHEYWNVLRACPPLRVALDEGSDARVLVSPMGLRPGVLFSAIHACRSDGGFGEPTECIVVCSAETEGSIAEALRAARYEGAATPLVLSDPHGGGTEIERLLTGARRRIFGVREMLVNVTGGTTLMGLAAEALANEGRRLACPVRRFGIIDRRPGPQQDSDPYRIGEPYWLDEEGGW